MWPFAWPLAWALLCVLVCTTALPFAAPSACPPAWPFAWPPPLDLQLQVRPLPCAVDPPAFDHDELPWPESTVPAPCPFAFAEALALTSGPGCAWTAGWL